MNYELALQLKDAGFPHKHNYCSGTECGYMGVCLQEEKDICIPTLSELIEACGERFTSLWKMQEGWQAKYMEGVFEVNSNPVLVSRGIGSTPEEAVAKFWLSLQNSGSIYL